MQILDIITKLKKIEKEFSQKFRQHANNNKIILLEVLFHVRKDS